MFFLLFFSTSKYDRKIYTKCMFLIMSCFKRRTRRGINKRRKRGGTRTPRNPPSLRPGSNRRGAEFIVNRAGGSRRVTSQPPPPPPPRGTPPPDHRRRPSPPRPRQLGHDCAIYPKGLRACGSGMCRRTRTQTRRALHEKRSRVRRNVVIVAQLPTR